MTTEAKRKALTALIKTADAETIDSMYVFFISRKPKHDIYGFYKDKLTHLEFPENVKPKTPGKTKLPIMAAKTNKDGRKKK